MLSPPPPLWTPPSFPLRTPTIAHVPMFDDLVVQYRKWNWKSQDYWFPCILSGSNSLGFQCQGRWQKIFNYKRFLAELLMASEYTGTRRFLIALRSKGWMQSRQVSEGWMKSLIIGIQQIKATQDIRVAWIILNNQWGWRKSHLGNCIECRLDLCYSAATIKKGSICKKDSWRIFVQPQTDTTRVWQSCCCFDLCRKKDNYQQGVSSSCLFLPMSLHQRILKFSIWRINLVVEGCRLAVVSSSNHGHPHSTNKGSRSSTRM